MKARRILIFFYTFLFYVTQCNGTQIYIVDNDDQSIVIGTMNVAPATETKDSFLAKIKDLLNLTTIDGSFLDSFSLHDTFFAVEKQNGWVYQYSINGRNLVTVEFPDKQKQQFLVLDGDKIGDLKNKIASLLKKNTTQLNLFNESEKRLLLNKQQIAPYKKEILKLKYVNDKKITVKVQFNEAIKIFQNVDPTQRLNQFKFTITREIDALKDQYTKMKFKGIKDESETFATVFNLEKNPEPTLTIKLVTEPKSDELITWRSFLDDFNNFKSGNASSEMKKFIEPILSQIKNQLTQNEDTYIRKIFTIGTQGELDYQKKFLSTHNFGFNDSIETFLSCSFNIFAMGIISDTISALLLAERIKRNKSLNEILDHLTDKQEIASKISKYITQSLGFYIDLWLTIYNSIYSLYIPQEIWDKGKKIQTSESDIHKAAKKYYTPLGNKTPEAWNQFTTQFTNLFTNQPPQFMEIFRLAIGHRMQIIIDITKDILESSIDHKIEGSKATKKINYYFKITRLQPDLNKLKNQIDRSANNKDKSRAKREIASAVTDFMNNFVLTGLLDEKEKLDLYEGAKNFIPKDLVFLNDLIAELDKEFLGKIKVSETLSEHLAVLILNSYLQSRAQWHFYNTEDAYTKTVPNLQKSTGKLKDLALQNEIDFYDAEFSKILLTIHFALIPEITFQAHEKKSTGGYIPTLTPEEIAARASWNKKMKSVEEAIGESKVLQSLSLKQNLVKLRNNLTELKTKLNQLNQKLESLKSRL